MSVDARAIGFFSQFSPNNIYLGLIIAGRIPKKDSHFPTLPAEVDHVFEKNTQFLSIANRRTCQSIVVEHK